MQKNYEVGFFLKKIVKILFTLSVIYFASASAGLKYYLSELIFKNVPDVESKETIRYLVSESGNELIIRLYGDPSNQKSAIFFPGQHGGVLRYEKEIFGRITSQGISVYSLSYPGYEGAKGKSTYISVKNMVRSSLNYINENTSCKIRDSIYIGRSLGASVALIAAENIKPRGIVLDSLALSLSDSIRVKLAHNIYTRPLNFLPIEKLVAFDISSKHSLSLLMEVPIIVFQGSLDITTPLENIDSLLKKYNNVKLYVVEGATHMNTHVLSGSKYGREIAGLIGTNAANKAGQADQPTAAPF